MFDSLLVKNFKQSISMLLISDLIIIASDIFEEPIKLNFLTNINRLVFVANSK